MSCWWMQQSLPKYQKDQSRTCYQEYGTHLGAGVMSVLPPLFESLLRLLLAV